MTEAVRTLAFIWIALSFPVQLHASEVHLPPPASGDITFAADVSSFFLEDGTRYEEIAFRFPTSQFEFRRQASGKYLAQYEPNLEIRDTDGQVVKTLKGSSRLELSESEREQPDRLFYDMIQLQLEPGAYTALFRITDLHSGKSAAQSFPIGVETAQPGHLTASDLYIASPVDPAPYLAHFRKGNRVLLPNLTRTVTGGHALHFHIQFANLGRKPHSIHFRIQDTFGHDLWSSRREFPGYRDRAAFTEGVSVRGLLTGTYTLIAEARAGADQWTSKRDFRVAGKDVEIAPSFDESAADRAARILDKFSGKEAADTFRKLDRRNQTVFLYNHWRSKNDLVASTYVGPLLGYARHEMTPETLGALGIGGQFKKRVDPVYAARIPLPDSAKVSEAARVLDAVIDRDKADQTAAIARATLYIYQGKFPRAEADLNRLKNKDITSADLFDGLGLTKLGRKDWKEAAEFFEHAAAMDTERASSRVNREIARFLDGGTDGDSELDVLRRAVVYDDAHPELYYATGRKLEFSGELGQAESAYLRQLTVNPQHSRAKFDLARVSYKLEKHDTAIALWRELMAARHDYFLDCVLPLFEAYQAAGRTADAQTLISEVLGASDDTTRALLEDIRLVASTDEVNALAATENKTNYILGFWQRRDPTPATPGNERLVEHYRRVFYALRNFSQGRERWDRRGDIYIRYGEPAHASSRGNIRFETDQDVVNVKERLWNGLSNEARQEIVARATRLRTSVRDTRVENESGSQVDIGDFESIDFELDPNRGFFGTSSLNEDFNYYQGIRTTTRDKGFKMETHRGLPIYPIDGTSRWEYWIYPDVAGGIEIQFVSLSSEAAYDYPALPGGRKLSTYNRKAWSDRHPEAVMAKAVKNHPDLYALPSASLDFHTDSADFSGGSGRSRLEIYYGVPLKDLVDGGRDTGVLDRGVALFDSSWATVYRKTFPLPFRVDADTEVLPGTLIIDEIALSVPPGDYHLGLQINDTDRGTIGAYWQDVVIEAYAGDVLQLSDIQMAGRVTESEGAAKGGLKVVPLPSRTYRPGQPVTAYYETYGLDRDTFGQTRYRVDYRITPKRGKLSAVRVLRSLGKFLGMEEEAVVTISYERSGESGTENNYIEIDMGASQKGRYELEITATDLISGQTAAKDILFNIAD